MLRLVPPVLAAAVVLLGAVRARGDDPPRDTSWSAPRAMPERRDLPPPRVIDPRAPDRLVAAPARAASAPAGPALLPAVPSTAPRTPGVVDRVVRPSPDAEEFHDSTLEALSLAPPDARPDREPERERPEEEAPRVPTLAEILAAAPADSTVLHVQKRHNQPWFGVWLALELDMWFAVVGEAGQEVGASVTFFEARGDGSPGRPLRARMQPYVDALGNVSVYTKPVRVNRDRRLFRARLKIPYRAFPWPTSGPEYGVEARVHLLRREPRGTVTPLAAASTTFRILIERDCLECVPESAGAPKSAFVRALEADFRGLFDDRMREIPPDLRRAPPSGWDAPQWFEWHWPECEEKADRVVPMRCRSRCR